MQLHSLKLINFRQHVETELVLGPGITAVIGPNGAGKTTLLEALAWAFYGNQAARGGRDSIRWNRAPARSQVRVEVAFTLGAHEYVASRSLYGAELYQDGSSSPIANSQQAVTDALTRLFGMTREEFFHTYFTSQKELAVMAGMGPTERGRFLSRILGYEKLRMAQDTLRSRRSELKGELAGLERGLQSVEQLEAERQQEERRLESVTKAVSGATKQKGAADAAFETEKPSWDRMVELRDSVRTLDGERRSAEQNVVAARREFDRLDRDLAEVLEAQRELRPVDEELRPVPELRAELDRLDEEAKGAGRRREVVGQLEAIKSEVERLDERLAKMDDAEQVLAAAEGALERARGDLADEQTHEESAHTAWVRDRQDAETKRLSLRDQYRELTAHRGRIVDAGPDGECPTCGRPLGKDYSTLVDTLGQQLEEIEINGRFFKQRVEQLTDEPEGVREAEKRRVRANAQVEAAVQEVARATAQVREAESVTRERKARARKTRELEREMAALPDAYDAEKHDEVKASLRRLQPRIELAARLRAQAARAEGLVRDAEAAERRLTDLEALAKRLVKQIAESGFSESVYEEAKHRFEEADKAVRVTELKLASLQGDLRAAETALRAAAQRLRERAEQAKCITTLRGDVRLHDELDAALGDLRTELNARMRPELSEVASEFLVDLTDGRYTELELDEAYGIMLMDGGMPKPVISGGEEDVANVALRLAISQMVAERAGQPLSLLVLDEIFGSLDETRREHVVDLLRRLGNRFPQVVLITHIDSVRDRVDRVVRVSVENSTGAARVTEDGGGSWS